MRYSLDQLEIFSAVVEAGSFSAAARRQQRTQSSVSAAIANLEAETFSLSDLEELARWLRGDLAAAVAGQERMEGAVGRGVNRLLVRVLGMPAKRVRVRTATFEVGEPAPAGSSDRTKPPGGR